MNIDVKIEDKPSETIYKKYEINLFGTQQMRSNSRGIHYSQKTSENPPIPGRLPMSDIASLLGSNMDLSETQKIFNSEDHLTQTSLNMTRQNNQSSTQPIH